jgi:hypothetical protein
MYQASNAFHNAVANNEPQIALLVFDDAIFSNADIDVDAGIELDDYFNTEEDLAIGQALSNEIRFSVFNDDRMLNDYEFGEFVATIGVKTGVGTYKQYSPITVYDGQNEWTGFKKSPYLKLNGTAVSSQPDFSVNAIAVHGDTVYVFGSLGYYKAYTTDGVAKTVTLNAFMRTKVAKWNNIGYNLNMANRRLTIYQGGISTEYEFVPLGTFIAKRPNVPDVNQIMFTCHDRMTKFDVDMPDKTDLGITYPCTISNLFEKMCDYVDVPYATSTFINSTATITTEPEAFETATMREVMQWIAEAAASNLRFNRNGILVFDWIRTSGLTLDEHDYIEYSPYWYETTQVDKLYNRKSESGEDKTVGTGDIGYLIQDNPLLEGVT